MAYFPNFNDPNYGFDQPQPYTPPGWGMAAPTGGSDLNINGGALNPQPQAQGPLSGNMSLGDFWQSGVPAALGGALLAAHGNLSNGLANFGQVAPQVAANAQKRTALNNWLRAKSSGNAAALETATQALYRADPSMAESVVSFQLTPHPRQLTYNPITGAAGTYDQYSGDYQALPAASGAAGGAGGAFPPGFIFGGSKPYTDPSTGETGLIDVNGVKAPIGRPNPSADQAQSASAATIAKQANDVITKLEPSETTAIANAITQAGNIPIAGPFISSLSPEGRQYEGAKLQFMQAIRGLAAAAKLNPDAAEFQEPALFPQQGASKEEIKQKDDYRASIIEGLRLRAGAFAPKQDTAAASAAQPAATAGKLPTFATPAAAMASGLKSGDHFMTSDGREKVMP